MAVRDWFGKSDRKTASHNIASTSSDGWTNFITEQAKGVIEQPKARWPADWEPHPEDYKVYEEVYTKVPIVHGAINKTVDAAVGPGFRLKSSDERVEEFGEMIIKDFNFDSLLRNVMRDLLIYGSSFVEIVGNGSAIEELRCLTPKFMYVKRDKHGLIKGYSQWMGGVSKAIDFAPDEVLQFNHNTIGNKAYGTSLVQPLIKTLEFQLQLERDMSRLFTRKAGAPLHIKVGSAENPADNSTLTTVKSQFEDMRNNQEYITSHEVEMEILSFEGKVMDPKAMLEYNQDQIVFGLEVPLVLLGKGNVPEGLAMEQGKAFQRRITALQQAVELVLEQDLFPRLLQVNGLAGDVEFEWEAPTEEQTLSKVQALSQVLALGSSGVLAPDFMRRIEQEISTLLGFEELAPESFEERPQPRLPGTLERLQPVIESAPEDLLPLKEYVRFNYQEYIDSINEFIDSNEFEKRRFLVLPVDHQRYEVKSYSLKTVLKSERKVEKLREVLKDAFRDGDSIRDIQKSILDRVRVGDIKVKAMRGDTEYELYIPRERHALLIARTETIRASNQGALWQMEDVGIKEVRWLAHPDACELCMEAATEDGILTIAEADERIPVHPNCRCAWTPVNA